MKLPYEDAQTQIILIAHNLRSTHNVGSLLRTADGLGIRKVILSGYTPYPIPRSSMHILSGTEDRLPHIANKIHAQITKTALGAENTVAWEHMSDILSTITNLRTAGWKVMALEQTPHSIPLPIFAAPDKLAIIVGREVEGIEAELLAACDGSLEIPMFGHKESFNVTQAAAMALYHCRFCSAQQ